VSVCALLAAFLCPLAPRLAPRLPGIVRRLHGYYAESDFPRSCIIGFGSSLPDRTKAANAMSAARSAWDLPVPVQEALTCRVCDHAGSSGRSQVVAPVVMAFHIRNCVAPGI